MRPLEGIRVLDLTHALSGPLCTFQLGLLGADVIKIERRELGDDLRHYTEHAGLKAMSAPFVAANAGKRSLTLDLKSPRGREVIARLIERADVLVENFRPGVPAKLGLDYPAVRARKPDIVHCTVTGFGQAGPLKDWPAYDHIIQAISGVMFINGEPEQGPLKVGVPFADTVAGHLAAQAVLAALFQRQRTGEGQFIDVAMLEAMMTFLAQSLATYRLSGAPPIRTGNRGYRLVATADTYRTADGYLAIGANHQPQWERLCEVLGQRELLADPRFADHRARHRHNAALRERLVAILATRSAAELETKLAEARVPAAMVRDIGQIAAHPQLASRGSFYTASIPGLPAPIALAGAGFHFAHDGPQEAGAVPTIGQHTDEILRELGFDPEAIAAMRAAGDV